MNKCLLILELWYFIMNMQTIFLSMFAAFDCIMCDVLITMGSYFFDGSEIKRKMFVRCIHSNVSHIFYDT